MAHFPIIDITKLTTKYLDGNGYEKELHLDSDVQQISKEIINGFTQFGFIYIKGHGIDDDLIHNIFKSSKDFFELEKTVKNNFLRNPETNWGYVPFNVETFDKSRPFDLKECFNMYPLAEKREELDKFSPGFWQIYTDFYSTCKSLSYLLLKTINIALNTDDPEFLFQRHQKYGDAKINPTILRLLYYPSIDEKENVLEKQLRCGEHSDYGTMTLLFQDDAGGLQVWKWPLLENLQRFSYIQ